MKKVMVFGVFDGVHDGHRALFRQAKRHGEHLIAVVTQDHLVEWLKWRLPRHPLPNRIDALSKEKIVDRVVLGDAELGVWQVVREHRPDVIALGYDQEAMRAALESVRKDFDWPLQIKVMEPFEPEKYHSSILP